MEGGAGAASLWRLLVSAVLLRASRRRFALASMHLRINTIRSCARQYCHIPRLTSKRLLPLQLLCCVSAIPPASCRPQKLHPGLGCCRESC